MQALTKYMQQGNFDAVFACIVVLNLDNGKRADTAIKQLEK